MREHEQLIETGGEFFRRDVVGVSSERGMAPGLVDRIRIGATSSAKLGKPAIKDVHAGELALESVLAELWKPARAWETPHVGHEFDLVQREQTAKLVTRARRVADGPNEKGR